MSSRASRTPTPSCRRHRPGRHPQRTCAPRSISSCRMASAWRGTATATCSAAHAPQQELPPSFYTAWQRPDHAPAQRRQVDFTGKLRPIDFSVTNDEHGEVVIRLYWQALAPLDEDPALLCRSPGPGRRNAVRHALLSAARRPVVSYWWGAGADRVGANAALDARRGPVCAAARRLCRGERLDGRRSLCRRAALNHRCRCSNTSPLVRLGGFSRSRARRIGYRSIRRRLRRRSA